MPRSGVFAHSRAEGLATAARVTPRPRYPAAVLHRPLQALMARRLVVHLIARGHRVARARWLGRREGAGAAIRLRRGLGGVGPRHFARPACDRA